MGERRWGAGSCFTYHGIMTRTALTTAPTNPLFSVHTTPDLPLCVNPEVPLCELFSTESIEASVRELYSLRISVFLYTNAQLSQKRQGKSGVNRIRKKKKKIIFGICMLFFSICLFRYYLFIPCFHFGRKSSTLLMLGFQVNSFSSPPPLFVCVLCFVLF